MSKPKDINHLTLQLWDSQTRLSSDERVVRVIKESSQFHFSVNNDPPNDLFRPNETDWEEGRRRNKQPLASTFKEGLTEQQLREARNLSSESTAAVYAVRSGDIDELAINQDSIPVELHNDPNGEAHGECHCGLQGMYKEAFQTKTLYRNSRDELLQICKPYPETI